MVAKLREPLRDNSLSCRDSDLGGVKPASGGNSDLSGRSQDRGSEETDERELRHWVEGERATRGSAGGSSAGDFGTLDSSEPSDTDFFLHLIDRAERVGRRDTQSEPEPNLSTRPDYSYVL